METIRLPRMFFDDHRERDLDTPEVIKQTARYVWVDPNDPAMPELIEDAQYYVDCRDSFTDESLRYCDAAARLLRTVINHD